MRDDTRSPIGELLSMKEAAALIGVSVDTIQRYARKGALHVIRRGPGPRPRVLVRMAALVALFHEDQPLAPGGILKR